MPESCGERGRGSSRQVLRRRPQGHARPETVRGTRRHVQGNSGVSNGSGAPSRACAHSRCHCSRQGNDFTAEPDDRLSDSLTNQQLRARSHLSPPGDPDFGAPHAGRDRDKRAAPGQAGALVQTRELKWRRKVGNWGLRFSFCSKQKKRATPSAHTRVRPPPTERAAEPGGLTRKPWLCLSRSFYTQSRQHPPCAEATLCSC